MTGQQLDDLAPLRSVEVRQAPAQDIGEVGRPRGEAEDLMRAAGACLLDQPGELLDLVAHGAREEPDPAGQALGRDGVERHLLVAGTCPSWA